MNSMSARQAADASVPACSHGFQCMGIYTGLPCVTEADTMCCLLQLLPNGAVLRMLTTEQHIMRHPMHGCWRLTCPLVVSRAMTGSFGATCLGQMPLSSTTSRSALLLHCKRS